MEKLNNVSGRNVSSILVTRTLFFSLPCSSLNLKKYVEYQLLIHSHHIVLPILTKM